MKNNFLKSIKKKKKALKCELFGLLELFFINFLNHHLNFSKDFYEYVGTKIWATNCLRLLKCINFCFHRFFKKIFMSI